MAEPAAEQERVGQLADEEARLARQAALTVRLREAGQDMIFVEALLGVREGELRAMQLHLEPAELNTVRVATTSAVLPSTAAVSAAAWC